MLKLININGILLVPDENGTFMLPGGHAHRGEPRIIAAIRELHEETRLRVTEIKFLFEFESTYFYHKVFYARAEGIPVPSDELSGQTIAYYSKENVTKHLRIMNSTRDILTKYLSSN